MHLLYSKDMNKKSRYLTNGEFKCNKYLIWQIFFRMNRKAFWYKNYAFNNMIETGSVSVSILMNRRDLMGKRAPKKWQPFDQNDMLMICRPTNVRSNQRRKWPGLTPTWATYYSMLMKMDKKSFDTRRINVDRRLETNDTSRLSLKKKHIISLKVGLSSSGRRI